MRDLYARLSLTPTAPVADIKAAIALCPHDELRSDATAVLLNSSRRRTYDQLHATLTRIGSLRASLGLVPTRLWQGQRDFDGEVTGTGSRYGEFMRKRDMGMIKRRPEKTASKAESPLTKLIGVLRRSP